MINKCRFFNLALTLCSLTNGGCQFMADPPSCPGYDEPFESPYPKPSTKKRKIDYEAELNKLGVKTERIEEAPDWF